MCMRGSKFGEKEGFVGFLLFYRIFPLHLKNGWCYNRLVIRQLGFKSYFEPSLLP